MNNIETMKQVEMLKEEYLKACKDLGNFRTKVDNEIMKIHKDSEDFCISDNIFKSYVCKLGLKNEYKKLELLKARALRKAKNFNKQYEHSYYDEYLGSYEDEQY